MRPAIPWSNCLVPSTSLDLNAQGPRNWADNGHWELQDANWHKYKVATIAIEQLFFRFWWL